MNVCRGLLNAQGNSETDFPSETPLSKDDGSRGAEGAAAPPTGRTSCRSLIDLKPSLLPVRNVQFSSETGTKCCWSFKWNEYNSDFHSASPTLTSCFSTSERCDKNTNCQSPDKGRVIIQKFSTPKRSYFIHCDSFIGVIATYWSFCVWSQLSSTKSAMLMQMCLLNMFEYLQLLLNSNFNKLFVSVNIDDICKFKVLPSLWNISSRQLFSMQIVEVLVVRCRYYSLSTESNNMRCKNSTGRRTCTRATTVERPSHSVLIWILTSSIAKDQVLVSGHNMLLVLRHFSV